MRNHIATAGYTQNLFGIMNERHLSVKKKCSALKFMGEVQQKYLKKIKYIISIKF